MSHDVTTRVTHRLDLTEQERFDYRPPWSKSTVRVLSLRVDVIDGSFRSADGTGHTILKSGKLGSARREVYFYRPYDEHLAAVLRAHGIPVAS